MDFYPDGRDSPSFHVKPTRNKISKLGFQSAEMKSEALETVKEDAF